MFLDQVWMKPVVACRHRSVCCENYFARYAPKRFVKSDAFVVHTASNCFKDCECTMAFVEMKHPGSDAHCLERSETADAEKKFLAYPNSSIAAVQAGCQVTVFRRIARDVGIQKDDVTAANLQSPDFCTDW